MRPCRVQRAGPGIPEGVLTEKLAAVSEQVRSQSKQLVVVSSQLKNASDQLEKESEQLKSVSKQKAGLVYRQMYFCIAEQPYFQ